MSTIARWSGVRPYVRVSGNLSLTVTDLSANLPAFNSQKLLSDSVTGDDQTPAAEPDAEVSFVTCDLAAPTPRPKVTPAACDLNSLLPRVKPSTLLSLDNVLTRVHDVAASAGTGSAFSLNADGTPNLKLSYAAEGQPDAYFGFAPRVVPENVTLLPKTTAQLTNGGDWSERAIVVKKGETVGSILRELGAPARRDQKHHRRRRPARARRRRQGRPEASRADDAGRPRP